MKTFFASAALLFLVGCGVPPPLYMVHPNSGDIRNCAEDDVFLTQAKIDQCIQTLRTLGYLKASELTPQQRLLLRPVTQPPTGPNTQFVIPLDLFQPYRYNRGIVECYRSGNYVQCR